MTTGATSRVDSPAWWPAVEWLRCPRSGARLVIDGDRLVSCDEATRFAYPVRDNVPVLLAESGIEIPRDEWQSIRQRSTPR